MGLGSLAAELFVKVSGDNAGAVRAINGTNDAVVKSDGFLKGAAKQAIGFGAAMISLQATGMVFDGIKNAVFGTNAQLEKSTLQFETLMGSADKAEAHVADLFDFAKKTPFETGPIIDASRIMRTFGGDSLDTMDNLSLFGDAAAATSQPINDIAFWMSRAYAAIQGGQPFGEARMRLMEMGVITPQVAAKLDELSASGADSSEVWGALTGEFGKFGGAMEKQAGTWEGITSTLADTVNLTLASAFKGLFEQAKGAITGITGFFSDPAVQKSIENIARSVGDAVSFIANLVGAVAGFVGPLVSGFTSAGSAVGVFAAPMQDLATQIAPAISKAFSFLSTEVMPALNEAFSWIATNIFPVLSEILGTLASTILPILGQAFTSVVDIVIASWPTIKTIAGVIGSAVKVAFDVISAAIKAVAPIITWLAKTVFPILVSAAGFLSKAIGQAFDFISKAAGQAGQVIGAVGNVITAAWNGVQKGLQVVWAAISGVFKTGLNFIIGIGNSIIRAINGIQVHIGRIGVEVPGVGFVGVGPFDWNGLRIPYLRPFEKGTWDTGAGLTPALLHPHEAVFPRAAAEAIREMADQRGGGGGGGGMTVVVQVLGTMYGYDKGAIDELGDRIGDRVAAVRPRRRVTA